MQYFITYLDEALGLKATYAAWDIPAEMPIFLKKAADYYLCSCAGVDFVAAAAKGGETLPELKRIASQSQRYSSLPVAIVSRAIDPRQRRALVRQGVPFAVPYKHVYLPFLALVAKAELVRRSYAEKLTPRTQAALVTLITRPEIASAQELREVTGMSAPTMSRVVDELSQHGLVERGKDGRSVVIAYDRGENALLRRAMPLLCSPVARTVFARKDDALGALPLAGESALAARSMLGAPRIEQRAVSKVAAAGLEFEEVLEGELPDAATVELEIWSYDPLIAGGAEIDDVSLAASLVSLGDERISIELNRLFGEDGLWR